MNNQTTIEWFLNEERTEQRPLSSSRQIEQWPRMARSMPFLPPKIHTPRLLSATLKVNDVSPKTPEIFRKSKKD